MTASIQTAVMNELERARGLPLIDREDARAAISHALAAQLVDCLLRQGRHGAILHTGAYEVCIRPVEAVRAQALPVSAMLMNSGCSAAEIDTVRNTVHHIACAA